MFSETKKRLEKRTGIKGKAFEKIKFAILRRYQKPPTYINDGKSRYPNWFCKSIHAYLPDDILYEEGNPLEEDAMLGLDHLDRTRVTRNGAEMFLK